MLNKLILLIPIQIIIITMIYLKVIVLFRSQIHLNKELLKLIQQTEIKIQMPIRVIPKLHSIFLLLQKNHQQQKSQEIPFIVIRKDQAQEKKQIIQFRIQASMESPFKMNNNNQNNKNINQINNKRFNYKQKNLEIQ
ncbi:transmembrane protein, putative (macronuclear) [Tetrahymena thermophila SB210]|uniref:Transmembrane protein, putative n=1 Tax=Tetrahymena thermophila (strain SB210) TaxID=312017 RepID=W7XJ01_TETTS|nr:transmembrane protein, putative [Tetrahymena thermophila SB210]EWS73754.1 transmembrane protein, putative [Tetrahymena thermophila SB210]|eukprot:XP_012653718.1 transmembrane protein, putative [Tetrahymena thermophila SB210]